VHWKFSEVDHLRLHWLNDMWKLARKEGVIEVHKQMLLALSMQHISQIDHVLHVGFKNGAGIHIMLNLSRRQGKEHIIQKDLTKRRTYKRCCSYVWGVHA
jgi:hypothetical protein